MLNFLLTRDTPMDTNQPQHFKNLVIHEHGTNNGIRCQQMIVGDNRKNCHDKQNLHPMWFTSNEARIPNQTLSPMIVIFRSTPHSFTELTINLYLHSTSITCISRMCIQNVIVFTDLLPTQHTSELGAFRRLCRTDTNCKVIMEVLY